MTTAIEKIYYYYASAIILGLYLILLKRYQRHSASYEFRYSSLILLRAIGGLAATMPIGQFIVPSPVTYKSPLDPEG